MSDILMYLGHFGMSLTLVYIHRSEKLLVGKKITYREDATKCDTFITKPLTLKENKKFECYLVAVTQGHLQPRCLTRKREKHNEKWKQFHKKKTHWKCWCASKCCLKTLLRAYKTRREAIYPRILLPLTYSETQNLAMICGGEIAEPTGRLWHPTLPLNANRVVERNT